MAMVERPTGRKRQKQRLQLSHLSGRKSFFGILKGFQEKHSKFRVFFSMLVILMVKGSLAACTFMTEDLMETLTETLNSKLSGPDDDESAKTTAYKLRKNNTNFVSVYPNAKKFPSERNVDLQLNGCYQKEHKHKKEIAKKGGKNDMARAIIGTHDSHPGRLKFNYAIGPNITRAGRFPGFSTALYNEDVTIYSVILGGKPYYILTVLQGSSHYIIIPFETTAAKSKTTTHLRIYSTLNRNIHDYIKIESDSQDAVLGLLKKDMKIAWDMPLGKPVQPNNYWWRVAGSRPYYRGSRRAPAPAQGFGNYNPEMTNYNGSGCGPRNTQRNRRRPSQPHNRRGGNRGPSHPMQRRRDWNNGPPRPRPSPRRDHPTSTSKPSWRQNADSRATIPHKDWQSMCGDNPGLYDEGFKEWIEKHLNGDHGKENF